MRIMQVQNQNLSSYLDDSNRKKETNIENMFFMLFDFVIKSTVDPIWLLKQEYLICLICLTRNFTASCISLDKLAAKWLCLIYCDA